MIPEDPLLFMGIFTVTVVACNVLLAWSVTRLAKAISRNLRVSEVVESQSPQESFNSRGPGRPKGAKDTRPRKPYVRRQTASPELPKEAFTPPPPMPEPKKEREKTLEEDYIEWLESQGR
jgi:hypothetical protein